MNELRLLLASGVVLISSPATFAADEPTVLGFVNSDHCMREVAEKSAELFSNTVAGACFRMFNAPDEQKSKYACIIDLARQTTDIQVVSAAFSDCSALGQ